MSHFRYPIRIIPKKYYKEKLDIDELAKSSKCFIVRRSDKLLEDTFLPETNTLREDVINDHEIPGLSMNILGGKFNCKAHLKYKCVGKAMQIWPPPKRTSLRKYPGCFSKLPIATPVYFNLLQVHKKPFPYLKADDKDAKKLKALFNPRTVVVGGVTKLEFAGIGYIKHTPNRLNYWHVEYTLDDIEGKEIEKAKNAWTKSASELAYINIICIEARKSIRKVRKIPRELYLGSQK